VEINSHQLRAVDADVNTVSVDIYDLTGKRVSARTIAVQDGFVNTAMDLNGDSPVVCTWSTSPLETRPTPKASGGPEVSAERRYPFMRTGLSQKGWPLFIALGSEMIEGPCSIGSEVG
jgi:hypothetical protein